MSKLWLISNTKFGYKNNNIEWRNMMIEYFEQSFIPFLEKNYKEGDKLIHLGNLFYNADNIPIDTLNIVMNLIEKISNIIPLTFLVGYHDIPNSYKNNSYNSMNIFKYNKNITIIDKAKIIDNIMFMPWTKTPIRELNENVCKYVIFNSDYLNYNADLVRKKLIDKKSFCGFYDDYLDDGEIIRLGAPYQLEKTNFNKGFMVIDTEKDKKIFIPNKFSPTFKTITIRSEDEITQLDANDVKYNHVNLVVDQSLIESKKLKLDILLSKFDFENVTYVGEKQSIEPIISDSMNIIDICREKVKQTDNQDIIDEFERIVKLKEERY